MSHLFILCSSFTVLELAAYLQIFSCCACLRKNWNRMQWRCGNHTVWKLSMVFEIEMQLDKPRKDIEYLKCYGVLEFGFAQRHFVVVYPIWFRNENKRSYFLLEMSKTRNVGTRFSTLFDEGCIRWAEIFCALGTNMVVYLAVDVCIHVNCHMGGSYIQWLH